MMTDDVMYGLGFAVGHLAHILKLLIQERQTDKTLTLRKYISQRPYKTLLSICGSIIGYLLLIDTGQISLVAAVGVGYMSDSVFEVTKTQVNFDRKV